MNKMAQAHGALCAKGPKVQTSNNIINVNPPKDLITENSRNSGPRTQRCNTSSLRKLLVQLNQRCTHEKNHLLFHQTCRPLTVRDVRMTESVIPSALPPKEQS